MVQHGGRLDAAIAEGAKPPQSPGAARRVCLNPAEELRDGLRRLAEVVGSEINFHGGGAHAKIVRIQRRGHQSEQPAFVLQASAPTVHALTDQVETFLRANAGALEQTFRLLLGGEITDLLNFRVRNGSRGPLRSGREGRCLRRRCILLVGPGGLETPKKNNGDDKDQNQKDEGCIADAGENFMIGDDVCVWLDGPGIPCLLIAHSLNPPRVATGSSYGLGQWRTIVRKASRASSG